MNINNNPIFQKNTNFDEAFPFDKIEGDFIKTNKSLIINSTKFKGFSLGGTLKGKV